MTPGAIDRLAETLDVGLCSPGVCPACLSLVASALEEGDGRSVAGRITMVAPDLWAEGLDQPVRAALASHARSEVAGAAEALADLDERGFRSGIFRAVVRRLARALAEDMRRLHLASLN